MNQHDLFDRSLAFWPDTSSTREELEAAEVRCTLYPDRREIFIPARVLRGIHGGDNARREMGEHILNTFGVDPKRPVTTTQGVDSSLVISQPLRAVPRNTNIVGFIGRRRAGKDTAAFCLMQHGYAGLKFAGALKAMIDTYLNYVGVSADVRACLIEGAQKELPITHLQGKSTRFAMQTLGTEWGRNTMGQDLWVDAAIARAKQFDKVVFTDVRFANEVAALQGIGATIIKIERAQTAEAGVDDHVSESEVDKLPYDFKIVNDSSVEKLHDAINAVIKFN